MYLNTPVVYSSDKPNVDRDKGIISNVTIAQKGIVEGHNVSLDDDFINDLVLKGNSQGPGLKARFGHPNICATALGTYLGRFKNFRNKEGAALADMHLDKTAIKSPNGDLYNYVLDMAENNPDMFGASIAFKQGEQVKVENANKPGTFTRFATIKNLYAADFVDSPAATDGLFELFHEEDLAFQTTTFLDDHPEIFEILFKRPEVLTEFLAKYKSYKKNKSMTFSENFAKVSSWISEQLISFFADNSPDTPEDVISNLQADFNSQLEDLQTNLSAENTRLTDENVELTGNVEDLTSQLNKALAKPTSKNAGDPSINLINPKTVKFNLLEGAPESIKRNLKTKLAKS